MYRKTQRTASPDVIREALKAIKLHLDISPGSGGSSMTNYERTTVVMTHIFDVVFPEDWGKSTIISLYPSAQIVAHRDSKSSVFGTRYHVPLQVNENCWVFHDGVWQQLEVGHVYRMDPTELHGAVNWGDTIRMHFMVDVR